MSFALFTPSYHGDLERCVLLCESVEQFWPVGTRHIVAVNKRDVPEFRRRLPGGVHIEVVEDIVAEKFFAVPFAVKGKALWLSAGLRPVRGWIFQQLAKLTLDAVIDEDVAVCCDSDVFFVRPVDPARHFLTDGKVDLLRTSYRSPEHEAFDETANRLLGIGSQPYCGNFIGNALAWQPRLLPGLRETVGGEESWLKALLGERRFSEYFIYGRYVGDRLGLEAANHAPTTKHLIEPSWGLDINNRSEIDELITRAVDSEAVGLMVHSKDRPSPALLRDIFAEISRRAATS